jgi:hypothetical protein
MKGRSENKINDTMAKPNDAGGFVGTEPVDASTTVFSASAKGSLGFPWTAFHKFET